MVQALPDSDVRVPNGMLPYSDKECRDKRFSIPFRSEVENLCRRTLNRRKRIAGEKSEEEANTWFKERVQGEKGPLRKVSLGVMSKELERTGNKLTLVLGASVTHEIPGKNSFGVTSATWDFPWFAIVLNVLCMAADGMKAKQGHFCAWELSFEESGKIGARALAESKQQPLDPDDRKLLELLGFRLVGSPLPVINLKKLGADPRDWPQKERTVAVRSTTSAKPKAVAKRKVIPQGNGTYMASIPGGDKKFLVPSKKRVPTKQEVENEVIARLTKDDRHLNETFYTRELEVYGLLEKIRSAARRVRLSGVMNVSRERLEVNDQIASASTEFRQRKQEIYPQLLEAIAKLEETEEKESPAKKIKVEETIPSTAQTSAHAEGSASPSNANQTEEKLTSTTTA